MPENHSNLRRAQKDTAYSTKGPREMNKTVPCLLRIGDSRKKYRHLPLIEDKVKIGRAPDTTHCILSTWISRYHATIEKQEDGSWSVTDNESLNGVALNGTQLEALKPYILRDGDVVQFGIPRSPDLEPEFVYQFLSSGPLQRESHKRPLSPDQGKEPKRLCENTTSSMDDRLHSLQEQKKKDSKREEEKIEDAKKAEEKRLLEVYEMQLRALADKLKEKEEEMIAVEQQLETERQQRVTIEQMRKEQEELDAKKRHLEEERAQVERQMQKELQARLEEQEKLLQEQMQQQLVALATEKADAEKRLQEQMEKAMQEKDRQLQERLKEEKEQLERVIESKELQQKALENQLMLSRRENENALEDKLKEKKSILSEFASTLETELQCAICSELFVQATSLNCSHAFCAVCIQQWLGLKRECPSCRTPVTSSVRSLVLDNYIDRMVEQLSVELKERRQHLVAERSEMQKLLNEAEKKTPSGPSGTNRNGRGRQRRGARGRARGQSGRSATTPRSPVTPDPSPTVTTVVTATVPTDSNTTPQDGTSSASTSVIVVSDESEHEHSELFLAEEYRRYGPSRYSRFGWSDYDDDEDDDSEGSENSDGNYLYFRGERGSYYGGFGRCFKCGARGHWANGCPF